MYLKCTQNGVVMDSERELKVINKNLKNTAFAPSNVDVAEHFIKGLKQNVWRCLEDQALLGWWTEPKELQKMAIEVAAVDNDDNERFYHGKWVGDDIPSWEPEASLRNCKQMISDCSLRSGKTITGGHCRTK